MNNLETPRAAALAKAILQLPDSGSHTARATLARIAAAEETILQAQKTLEDCVADLAKQLLDSTDGWTFDEVWKTDLRGDAVFMKAARNIANEA